MARIATILMLMLTLMPVSPASAADANRIVLRVNNRIATLYDYRQRLADRMRELGAAGLDSGERQRLAEEAPKSVMKEILNELLVLSRGDQLGVTPSELDIDDAINRMRERAGVEDEREFLGALAASGLTLEGLRAQAAQQLTWDEVMGREVFPRIQVSEDDMRSFYEDNPELFAVPEQIDVEEIVVLSDEVPLPADVRQLADVVHAQLAAGASLESMAEAHAEQVSSVIDVGWVTRGDLAPDLEEAIWALAAGELSRPLEGRGGLHLARVIERREATARPFEEVKDLIRRQERQRRYVDEVQEYLGELEESSYIVGRVPEEAVGFRSADGASPLEDPEPFRIREAGVDEGEEEGEEEDEESEDEESSP